MKKRINTIVIILVTIFSSQTFYAQNPLFAEDLNAQSQWVDSVFKEMTLDEKIGQLFMIDVFSNKSESEINQLKKTIKKYKLGGVIFSKGGPQRQAKITNEIQKNAKIPLLIGMDAEWGLAMRLDSTFTFPWNMTLGAIQDTSIVKEVGFQIGKHNKRLGVHINFAPVVDINTNPENPIIGNRSFGETKEIVSRNALAFMNGMHEAGILSNAKHFPGHGDTSQDSHKTLPTIDFTEERIRSVELSPFKKLIDAGVSSVMVAHLNVPSLDPKMNFPSSLSKTIVSDLLKSELNFDGLVITDALNMKGVSNFDEAGEVDVQALKAGSDILLISEDIPKAIQKIKQALKDGEISEQRLASSVKKILYAKYKVGLNNFKPVETENLIEDLNKTENHALCQKAIKNAVTLIKNDIGILPISDLAYQKTAYLKLGDDSGEEFFKMLNRFTKVERIQSSNLDDIKSELKNFDRVIIGYHKSDESPWASYKFSEQEIHWIDEISKNNKTILVNFTRPYSLLDLKSFINIDGIIQAYQNSKITQGVVAQQIFGALPVNGKLPVSITSAFPVGTGYSYSDNGRLGYDYPENLGFDPDELSKIDSIANLAIEEKMTPGMQILIARKGKAIFNKNFGFHTYSKNNPVEENDVYDLASVTKILATLPILMTLEEENKISLDTQLVDILPELANTNKANITVKDMLTHYARLEPWIPFYLNTLEDLEKYYKTQPSKDFNIKITEEMYLRSDFRDSIQNTIIDSDLRDELEYKYSDLPYYFLKEYIERETDSTLDQVAYEYFYKSMGANNLRFYPLKHFDENRIIPTENDEIWRKTLIKGTVHDQGAAMLGGVGGHAGLFGNATDVAKFMQMYLNGGYYGDKRYFSQTTIDKFNTCYYCDNEVRRGVGFDKPQLDEIGPTCGCLSMTSFGHSGFTGTYAWADPEKEIVYVFLSNRIHPDASNKKLIEEDIRTKIQGIIYQALEKE
ncbi:glycoside hydrolase family 3 N-terminal domain-containing protein [Psychroflexus aestuariivivens]|uniref:glycoside hydrolase family 3 N-terminal domain-containing protein n=1 Tax=Psychroflexus aestuariivivens TaxID=1795040 RepID=UPI000FDB1FA9|nr:glycoside hydrolase family 3 N-terminal domain-containing protein [Psychroflexus aestuariivivens]